MRRWRRGGGLVVLVLVGACEGLLDVDTSGVILATDLDRAGPAAIPTLVNGVIGSYAQAADDIARYAALLTDEMILGGTFPDRLEVDRRRIQPGNASVTDELYTPLHTARFQADTTVVLLQERLDDPLFAEAVDQLEEGIILGRLYGGYTRLWLAELFCWSILTGVHPETAPLLPTARIEEAIDFLEEAEELAMEGGFAELRHAARVGQARGHLWVGRFAEAAALAATVPRDFVYRAEYGNTNPDQFNEVYAFTWGDTEAIRWTVGDGTTVSRGNEAWEHLALFLELNLLRNRPAGFATLQGSIPVVLQTLYSRPEAEILLASGVEARLIRAEAEVRAGTTAGAELVLNDLRTDYSTRVSLRWGVTPPAPEDALAPLTLSGDFQTDLKRVMDERARELWLTGDRLTTARRLRLDPATTIDLFPPIRPGTGGDDIAFPIVGAELDNNPHLTSAQACPVGQLPGSWR